MPSGGVAMAMIINEEISAAIKKLPKKQRKDVRKMLDYSKRIGDTTSTVVGLTIVLSLALLVLLFKISGILAIHVAGCVLVSGCCYAHWRRQCLIKKMDATIARNPKYWNRIIKVLKRIVRRAGGQIIRK